jgi:beta-alanine--pyruvate transaminase
MNAPINPANLTAPAPAAASAPAAHPVNAAPKDLSNFWMPFTANRQYKQAPRLLAGAKGMHYFDPDGREILDGTAGLWCVMAGHGRDQIADAVATQMRTLDFAPTFQMGHPIAFDFATAAAKMAPEGLDRVFFTNSGSEAVDTALKIALGFHRARHSALV